MKMEALVKEFFERDGNAFLAFLTEKCPLVAEYSGPATDSKYLFLWEIWNTQLFKKFLQLVTNKKIATIYTKTKKDIRGLHQLKIYTCGYEYWIVFETCVRTMQDLKDVYLFFKGDQQ
jgi:hypothetical protein